MNFSTGSITDDGGDISFGSDNLSTTGTLGAGVATLASTSTVGNLTLADGSITDSSGAISFGDDSLTTTSHMTMSALNVGDANMSETDLEKLDGITNGTVAANKAVVVDGNLDASGFRNVTASEAFIIGSANMSETDIEKLDQVTNGTAAAGKAVVLDASKNIATIGTVGCGAVTSTGSSSFETLTVSTSAILANGSQMADATAPTADSDIANKKYVDDQLGSSALGFTADDATAGLEVDLDTESLTIAGGSNLTTSSAGNTATVAMDSDISLTSGTFSSKVTTAALSATGAANLDSTLDVDGQSDLKGAVNLAATGVATDIKGTLSVDEAATMDTTLAVTGVATFTEQSVHTGGIDCNGTLDLGGQSIEGNADEMVISADGDESSVSGSASGSLSLNASGGIFTDDAVDMDSTLNVEDVATFQAQSVHSSGIQTGGSIVSDTDSTDSLGSSGVRWLSVHTDKMEMEHSTRKDFSVAMDGNANEIANFAGFESCKVVLKVKDSSDNITTKKYWQ